MAPQVIDTPITPAVSGERTAAVDAAARWLDAQLAGQAPPPLLVVIGFGEGELLDVLNQRAPGIRILALEPDAATAAKFLRRPEGHRWRETGRLVYLADPEYAGADEAWRVFPTNPDQHKLILSPDIARQKTTGSVRAARVFKHILFGVKANAEARRRFAPAYLAGTLHNLPEVMAGHDVRGLKDTYRNMPAIVAAAGPSLDTVLDDLHAVRGKALLISADTALRPLLTRGLSPELVVAVDPQPNNARHFHGLPSCANTWLVSEASIDPSVIAPFGSRAFWFRVANHEPWPWYRTLGLDVGLVDVWGSVLTAAFQIAVLAGCDPIVIVGADLSFTGGRPYCRGTTYEYDWAHVIGEDRPFAEAWKPFLKFDDQIRMPDILGGEAVTTGAMQSFRDWMVARIRKSGRRVVNATGAGILGGDGIELRSLFDAIGPDRPPVPPPSAIPRVAPAATLTRADAAHRLWDVHRMACRNELATPPFDQWIAFAGEGFDVEAVGAAVERAARELERPAPSPAPTAAISAWPHLPWMDSARRVLRALPEATMRLRAALRGEPLDGGPASALQDVDPRSALIDAMALLRAIRDGAAAAEDLPLPVPPGHIGRTPLGALRTWPIEIGWAVRLFEGCLGQACSTPIAPAQSEPTYFSRTVTLRSMVAATTPSGGVGGASNMALGVTGLALEWLACGHLVAAESDQERRHIMEWWRHLTATLASSPDVSRRTALAPCCGPSDSVEIRLPGGDAPFARVLTGAAALEETPGTPPTSFVLGRVTGVTRAAVIRARMGSGSPEYPRGVMVVPRVLTDEGVVRGVLPYTAADGAVCTALRGTESFLVREDGSVTPGRQWPRPINGQMPFGDGGAIAWSVGSARWPEGGSGVVMWRDRSDANPSIEELPFAPQSGIWWHGRCHWVCYPFGVGSWAPGEAPQFALPDLTLFSVRDGGADLLLGPRHRTPQGTPERKLITQGFRWQPGQTPSPDPLGPYGVASTRTTSGEWSAIAHPEADRVRIEHADGRAWSLICYYPFGVAWTGRSLLVGTTEGELLLFERLMDNLEAIA